MLKSSLLQKTGSLPTHEVRFRQKTPMGSLQFTLQPPCTASCPLFSVSQALMLPPQLSLKASHAFAEKHEQHKRQLVKTIKLLNMKTSKSLISTTTLYREVWCFLQVLQSAPISQEKLVRNKQILCP